MSLMDEIVKEVANRYKVGLNSFSKSKAVFLLDTDRGMLIMRRHAECRKPETAYAATELLHRAGFKCAERYLTINGKPYITVKDDIYTLAACGNGSKCCLSDFGSVMLVAKTVAQLQKTRIISASEIDISKYALPRYYEKRISEARHIKKWLDKRSRLTDIDVVYIEKYKDYLDAAVSAVESICRYSMDASLCLAHGEMKEDNIFIDSENNVTLLNFENCAFAPPNTDLCLLLRRFVKRGGDAELIPQVISAYSEERPLSPNDMEYIRAFLTFPHKFLALVNKYYNSRRAFDNYYTFVKLKAETVYQEKVFGILNKI